MSGKVIDLDPTKRLSKEAYERIVGKLSELNPDDLGGFMLLYVDQEGGSNFEAFGIDWALLGISQAYLENLREQMLNDDSEDV